VKPGWKTKSDEVRQWYDGYLFGKSEVYNPWSIIHYVDDHETDRTYPAQPYWSNTSSNSIIRDMIRRAGDTARNELETLLAGGTIEKPVHEDVTYDDMYDNEDNLWNFMFFTGYLKKVSLRYDGSQTYLTMKIPNEEVASIYESQIREWFSNKLKTLDYAPLRAALVSGDTDTIRSFIQRLLGAGISYYDSQEPFYHGFLASLLLNMSGYRLLSNREAGNGRPDIVLEPQDMFGKDPYIIIEIKRCREPRELPAACEAALQQIRDRNYEAEYDYVPAGTKPYGIAFCRKVCLVAG